LSTIANILETVEKHFFIIFIFALPESVVVQ